MKFLWPKRAHGIISIFNLPVCNGWRQRKEKMIQLDVDCYAGIETVTYAMENRHHIFCKQFARQHRATFQRHGVKQLTSQQTGLVFFGRRLLKVQQDSNHRLKKEGQVHDLLVIFWCDAL